MTIGQKSAGGSTNHLRVPLWPMDASVVTPSNSTMFDTPVAIIVFDAGTVITTPAGTDSPADITLVVSAAMVANGPYAVPFMVKQVKATGTTSANILGVW